MPLPKIEKKIGGGKKKKSIKKKEKRKEKTKNTSKTPIPLVLTALKVPNKIFSGPQLVLNKCSQTDRVIPSKLQIRKQKPTAGVGYIQNVTVEEYLFTVCYYFKIRR